MMKGWFKQFSICAAVAIFTTLGSAEYQPALAADKKVVLPVAGVLATPVARSKLDGSVSFYFGNSPHPAVTQKLGEASSRKKTNAFAKSDAATCNHVLVSTLIDLQQKAQAAGGNAVINIRSTYEGTEVSYDDEFECHVGFLMSGVALKGDIATVER